MVVFISIFLLFVAVVFGGMTESAVRSIVRTYVHPIH
jgi:hypothetical protein